AGVTGVSRGPRWVAPGGSAQAAGDLGGPVGEDDVGARAADGGERLAADLVGGHRQGYARGDLADDVEVGERGLDHDDVGTLGDVQGYLAHGLAAAGRVLLVGRPVAELGRALGGLAERPVK